MRGIEGKLARFAADRHADDKERRLRRRWHLTPNTVEGELVAGHIRIPISVTDVSEGGLGGKMTTREVFLAREMNVRLALGDPCMVLHGVVKNSQHGRFGIHVADRETMARLVDLAKTKKAVAVAGRNGSVRVDGFVGFSARRDMRISRPLSEVDLSGATGIDSFGLGILLAHVEKGCRLKGCRGAVAELLSIAGFCERYCRGRGQQDSVFPCPWKPSGERRLVDR